MRNRNAGNRGFAKCTAPLLLSIMVGCELSTEPDVREQSTEFPLRANWSATIAPAGTAATVSGNLTIAEYLGSHFDATASITGGRANTAYQWRIFRGDCATNTAAPNAQSPTGLLLYGTIQAYPDLTTNATGEAMVSRAMAGALDSLTAYSVRVRLGQTATNWNGTNPLACGDLQRS